MLRLEDAPFSHENLEAVFEGGLDGGMLDG